jgi:hypothetical protein
MLLNLCVLKFNFLNFNTLSDMKINSIFLLFFAFISLITFTNCTKSAEEIKSLVTNSEAAEIIETAVSDRSGGTTISTTEITRIIESFLDDCGIPGDTTLQKSKTGAVSFQYTATLDWLVNCNALKVPLNATVNINGNSTFSVTRWSGSEVGRGTLTLTGLAPSQPDYIINGTYKISGEATGKLRKSDPTLSTVIDLGLKDVTVNKKTSTITGGDGSAKITLTSPSGDTQTINATLAFNVDGTVTITVNGHTHTF